MGRRHLHEFIAGDGERYGTPDPDYDAPGSVTQRAHAADDARCTGRTLSYVYDFGDYWEHRIKVEKTLAPDPADAAVLRRRRQRDAAGRLRRRAGLRGVRRRRWPIRTIRSTRTWPSGSAATWDPAAFDIEHVNSWLAEIKL